MKIEFNVKGTEKQVNWCKDILKNFNVFFENVTVENLWGDKACYEEAEKLINNINSMDAGILIMNKGLLESRVLNEVQCYQSFIRNYIENKGYDTSKLGKFFKFLRGKAQGKL